MECLSKLMSCGAVWNRSLGAGGGLRVWVIWRDGRNKEGRLMNGLLSPEVSRLTADLRAARLGASCYAILGTRLFT